MFGCIMVSKYEVPSHRYRQPSVIVFKMKRYPGIQTGILSYISKPVCLHEVSYPEFDSVLHNYEYMYTPVKICT